MTDTPITLVEKPTPPSRSKWWKLLLIISLMANLLVAGAAVGHFFKGRHFGEPMQQNFVQLIPRKFFDDLSNDRRRELMQVLRENRDDFKNMRQKSGAAALQLATALESPTYDSAAIRGVIDDFSTGRESLAGKAGAIVFEVINKLTPEERKQLAASIRDRSAHDWKKN
jgi:uncharacterized membrane protein